MWRSFMRTVILMSLVSFAIRNPAAAQEPAQRDAANMASTYVPLESWVYSAFDLLASRGYLQTAFFDLRPWTRMDCARLVDEATDLTAGQLIDNQQIARTLNSLRKEFAPELLRREGDRNREIAIESLDSRVTSIAGRPLTDGYHFAETLVNDEGRPVAEGGNFYSGVSLRATAGPFAAYIHGEIQRVPTGVSPDAQAMQEIAAADFTPTAAAGPASGFLRGRLLDANLSFAFFNNQLTFGKQSLWWGPARSGATLFTDNAEPVTMLRFDRLRPIELPSFGRWLGPIRAQLFVGRLSGTQFVRVTSTTFGQPGVALANQPWIHGEKIAFAPTPNLQFSVSRTVLFAGQGTPFTTATFLRSVFSTSTENGNEDPGDRRSAFDAEYRIPGVRDCLTAYVDAFSDDEPFPLLYPRRSVWLEGFALRCVPSMPSLTIRAEGLLSPHRDEFPGYYYFNVHYLSGYTNNRQLLGSWIGREGQGEQLWATWQLSPRSSVEVSGRSMNASADFLHGGTLRDLRAAADLALGREWQLHLEDQLERWRFPLLAPNVQRDNELTVRISYQPKSRVQ
jgi:hypothetical protein